MRRARTEDPSISALHPRLAARWGISALSRRRSFDRGECILYALPKRTVSGVGGQIRLLNSSVHTWSSPLPVKLIRQHHILPPGDQTLPIVKDQGVKLISVPLPALAGRSGNPAVSLTTPAVPVR